MNFLDLEFLATGSEPYRYPLEKNGHGRKQRRCKQEGGMPILLNMICSLDYIDDYVNIFLFF